MRVCSSGASRQTTSGGLSPSGKVASLYIRAWGVVLAQAMRRKTIPSNPGILGLGALASTPAMVSLVRVTCARFGASRRVGVPRAWVGEGGGSGPDSLGRNGKECRCSLSPGTGIARLACLRRCSPELGCRLRPLLGKLSLSVRLEFQESDIRRQSADALQDLVELTGFCFWSLLPPFAGRELFFIFFLLSLSFVTGFQSGVPFPL